MNAAFPNQDCGFLARNNTEVIKKPSGRRITMYYFK